MPFSLSLVHISESQSHTHTHIRTCMQWTGNAPSGAADVMYLLYGGVDVGIIRDQEMDLLRHYWEELSQSLRLLGKPEYSWCAGPLTTGVRRFTAPYTRGDDISGSFHKHILNLIVSEPLLIVCKFDHHVSHSHI